jgi:hypothetical protein
MITHHRVRHVISSLWGVYQILPVTAKGGCIPRRAVVTDAQCERVAERLLTLDGVVTRRLGIAYSRRRDKTPHYAQDDQ